MGEFNQAHGLNGKSTTNSDPRQEEKEFKQDFITISSFELEITKKFSIEALKYYNCALGGKDKCIVN